MVNFLDNHESHKYFHLLCSVVHFTVWKLPLTLQSDNGETLAYKFDSVFLICPCITSIVLLNISVSAAENLF